MRLLDDIAAVALDLDGTLIDSAPDLAQAISHMLRVIDARPLAEHVVVGMIGGGIHALTERALFASLGRPPSADEMSVATAMVIEHYRNAIFARSTVYPGVREGLAALRSNGLTVCCVTNKLSRLTEPLLAASDLARYFDHVLCAGSPAQRKPAPALLNAACARCDIAAADLLMVGDSGADIAAARAAGARVAAVTYGYNSPDVLRLDNPDWIISSLLDLGGIMLAGSRPEPVETPRPC